MYNDYVPSRMIQDIFDRHSAFIASPEGRKYYVNNPTLTSETGYEVIYLLDAVVVSEFPRSGRKGASLKISNNRIDSQWVFNGQDKSMERLVLGNTPPPMLWAENLSVHEYGDADFMARLWRREGTIDAVQTSMKVCAEMLYPAWIQMVSSKAGLADYRYPLRTIAGQLLGLGINLVNLYGPNARILQQSRTLAKIQTDQQSMLEEQYL